MECEFAYGHAGKLLTLLCTGKHCTYPNCKSTVGVCEEHLKVLENEPCCGGACSGAFIVPDSFEVLQ